MKKYFLIIALINVLNTLTAQTSMYDSTYYFNPDGTKNLWYIQPDMFLYRMSNGSSNSVTPNSIVDSTDYLANTPRRHNSVKFNNSANQVQKDNVKNNIKGTIGYDYEALVITKRPNKDYTKKEWYYTNDLIIIRFKNENLSASDLQAFMQRNNLSLYHQPNSNLPHSGSWSYVFQTNNNKNKIPLGNSFEICKYISGNEGSLVKYCEPDIDIYRPDACEPVSEFSDLSTTSTPDALWHIRNQGNKVYGTWSGVNDADADICECWGEGYHGENVKVAVIDFYGYDFSHPEMTGQFLNGWDFINNLPITNTKYVDNINSHGMEVASVIAANANNSSTFNAIGVAYNSKILPYLISGTSTEIIQAIQKAVADNADIINMSLGTINNSLNQSAMYADIDNAQKFGRGNLGCFVVASTGNNNQDIRNWPAADTIVFGVGASDPQDYRGSLPNWGWSGGSNYLTPVSGEPARYNVVAPGTKIMTAYTTGPLTSPAYSQHQLNGNSFSAPLVAGIGAIILSKNNTLNQYEIKKAIQNFTDKVKPGAYPYNSFPFLPGYNSQMFYGRVNCFNALTSIAVGIKEYQKENPVVSLAYLNSNEIGLFFIKGANENGFTLKVFDVAGKAISNSTISPKIYNYIINTNNYAQGMYIINIVSKDNSVNQSYKFIK